MWLCLSEINSIYVYSVFVFQFFFLFFVLLSSGPLTWLLCASLHLSPFSSGWILLLHQWAWHTILFLEIQLSIWIWIFQVKMKRKKGHQFYFHSIYFHFLPVELLCKSNMSAHPYMTPTQLQCLLYVYSPTTLKYWSNSPTLTLCSSFSFIVKQKERRKSVSLWSDGCQVHITVWGNRFIVVCKLVNYNTIQK